MSRLESKFREFGLIDIADINSDVRVELKYATEDNFSGENVYGSLKQAFFVPEVAEMVSAAQNRLSVCRPGFRLLIYDAARPLSIQRKFFRLVEGTDMEKYVANPETRGFHNYGLAVDLTILAAGGEPLDMGTGFDCFNDAANVGNEDALIEQGRITIAAKENRRLLRSLMESVGFTQNMDEWWHYQKYTLEEASRLFPVLDF